MFFICITKNSIIAHWIALNVSIALQNEDAAGHIVKVYINNQAWPTANGRHRPATIPAP
jgi:hypothetical protein